MRNTAVIKCDCTVFWKTDRIDTITKIHFLFVDESHTHALFRNTKHLRMAGYAFRSDLSSTLSNHEGAFFDLCGS